MSRTLFALIAACGLVLATSRPAQAQFVYGYGPQYSYAYTNWYGPGGYNYAWRANVWNGPGYYSSWYAPSYNYGWGGPYYAPYRSYYVAPYRPWVRGGYYGY